MSGTLPSSPAPRDFRIRSANGTSVSVGQSMAIQARSRNAQRWGLKLIYAPMTREDWAPLFAFFAKQRGRYESFQMVLPAPLYTPQGSIPGSPVVDNEVGSPTALQTGLRVVNTKGWTNSQTGVLKAGDFVKFTGHGKVYMVTADADSDGSGKAAIAIEPALLAGPAHESAITVSSVPFTVKLASDTLESDLAVNPEFGLEVEMMEAYP